MWGEGDEDRKLGEAVTGSLRVADRLKLNSIAFPAISTGIFGFPVALAARIILEAIKMYFEANPSSRLSLVRLTLYDKTTLSEFLEAADEVMRAS
jgi:O-acetyl-ADP-ribose deacetylase (regulator of RNase III)